VKGTVVVVNGEPWTVVDVAPAMPLAEMVAALLEEEGFVTIVRSAGGFPDMLSALGVSDAGLSLVLVPEPDAGRALALIEETVTDYVGEDLEAALAALAQSPDALGVDDEALAGEDRSAGGDRLADDDEPEDDDGGDLRRQGDG
jgi:hypothetical protein